MKIAFVVPWYGENIPGGAEALCRNYVKQLVKRGCEVEVLTTCVKDFQSNWNESYFNEDDYVEKGVPVKRFQIKKGNHKVFNEINDKLIHRTRISVREERLWMSEGINSNRLYEYIADNHTKYKFIFIPYCFPIAYYGMRASNNKGFLLPALHNEGYAYMRLTNHLFQNAEGLIFNTKTEKDFAEKIYSLNGKRNIVLGVGINTDIKANPEKFREKFGIDPKFILYAGRKDKTKNVHSLIKLFDRYSRDEKKNIKLVLIGNGTIELPENDAIVDLGFLSEEDKYNVFGAAEVLCQPSLNESFSIVMTEAWFLGKAVIVDARCDVTRNHCIEANGGLYYSDYYEFREILNYLLDKPDVAKVMGENGRRFVLKNYQWNDIIGKFVQFICQED